jgi:hypothetical protein
MFSVWNFLFCGDDPSGGIGILEFVRLMASPSLISRPLRDGDDDSNDTTKNGAYY